MYFCKCERAPQKRTLSGIGNSVLLLGSGSELITLIYVSCPKYHLSRFSALRFHTPTLSRDT